MVLLAKNVSRIDATLATVTETSMAEFSQSLFVLRLCLFDRVAQRSTGFVKSKPDASKGHRRNCLVLDVRGKVITVGVKEEP